MKDPVVSVGFQPAGHLGAQITLNVGNEMNIRVCLTDVQLLYLVEEAASILKARHDAGAFKCYEAIQKMKKIRDDTLSN